MIGPMCCARMMPCPSTTKLSGTPDEPSEIWTRLSASAPMRSNGSPWRARKAATSSGRSRIAMASIATPRRFRSSRTGASAAHGTHQLAKTLTSRGVAAREVGRGEAGLAGQRGRQGEGGQALAFELGGDAVVARRRETPRHRDHDQREDDQRDEARAAHHSASTQAAARAQAAPPAPDQRQQPAQRDEHAAEPDQRHERLPPQAQLPAPGGGVLRAEHGVELAVPVGLDRGFAGGRRGLGEEAALRFEDRHPAAARGAQLGLERGPVGPGDGHDRPHLDQPRADLDALAGQRGGQFLAREGGCPTPSRSAPPRPRDGRWHIPQMASGVRRSDAADKRREAGGDEARAARRARAARAG